MCRANQQIELTGKNINQAIEECNGTDTCKGIFDHACNGDKLFICTEGVAEFDSQTNGCTYEKSKYPKTNL